VKTGSVNTSVVTLSGYQNTGNIVYSGTATPVSAGIQLNFPVTGGTQLPIVINGGTTANVQAFSGIASGYVFTVTTYGDTLSGGQETVSYTTTASDTTSTIATNLASAFSADTKNQSLGLSATASSNNITFVQANPTYSASTNVGATETVSVGPTVFGKGALSIGGTPTVGDTINLSTQFPSLAGGTKTVTYTVQTGDNLDTIATGVSTVINANSNLQAVGVTSTSSASANFSNSENFTASPPVASGASLATASATDGGGTTKTNLYRTVTNGIPANQSLTFDLNGNMTSDGTNTYQWDAENRLIQINYPGTSNSSRFTYDGLGTNVAIKEYSAGGLTSTKQFVWAGQDRKEARDASGTVSAQYFLLGETISGTNYCFTRTKDGSVREMTDATGAIQGQLNYDPFGRAVKLQGTLSPDSQYADYYHHSASGLSLTVNRPYNANLGRWINRDPIEEAGGINLYAYVGGNPISLFDALGLDYAAIGLTPWNGPFEAPVNHSGVLIIDNDGVVKYEYDWGPEHEGYGPLVPWDEGGVGQPITGPGPWTSIVPLKPPAGMNNDQYAAALSKQAGQFTQNANANNTQWSLMGKKPGTYNCHTATAAVIHGAGGTVPRHLPGPRIPPGFDGAKKHWYNFFERPFYNPNQGLR
jgi:RHS repeat-associated protein